MAWLGAVVRSGLLVGVALRTARRRAAAVAELERVNRDLDERVRARTAELARSEARLSLALEAAAMAEWECDLATWTFAPSPRLSELFGYPPDRRLTIEDVRARYHPDDAERTRRMTAEALATGRRFAEYDYRIVLPDGAVRWLYTRGEVFRDADGRPLRAAGVVMDITERKRTDEALQASEAEAQRRLAELQTIYDTSPVGLCFVDAGLRFVKINERMAEANGLPVAAHLGRTLREVKPELADHVEGHLRRVIETAEPIVDLELRHRGEEAAGDRHWLCSYHPVRGSDGRVLGVNAVVQEITGRKRVEEALRRERELLQRIMDTIPVMIVLYEPDTRVLRLNPAFERIIGWTTEEARSVDLMAACYPDPDYRERVRAFMAEPQEGWMDIAMTARDGRVVQTSWANIRFPDNTRVGIGIDITERKRAEDRQRLLLAELSHRVKNTLATVMSIAMRSISAGRPVEEARDAFMERLRALADTHSLLTAGDWQGASLRRLVEDVLAPYGRRAAIASADVVLNPKAALTLGLVLHELATNAAKYGALAAPAGRVEVAWTIGDRAAAEEGDDGPRLRLLWRERGGPPVMPPERVGFGRTLIERAVAYDLDGTARLGFHPDGVVCELAAPLAEVAAGTT